MKYWLLFFFSINYLFCFAQNENKVFTFVEEMPVFPGGDSKLMDYLKQNIKFPNDLKDKHVGGRVYVNFIVDTIGKVTSAHVIRSSGFAEFDSAAIDVINSMPNWTPGKQSGKVVSVSYNLPINFSYDKPYFLNNVRNGNNEYKESIEKIMNLSYDKALKSLDKCIKENPEDFDALYNKAIIYYYTNDTQAFCKNLQLIINKSNDTNSTVQKNSKDYLEKYCN